jgi:hypothetical protein
LVLHAFGDHAASPDERGVALAILAPDQILIVLVGIDVPHIDDGPLQSIVTTAAAGEQRKACRNSKRFIRANTCR